MSSPRRVIVDADVGTDDFLALLILFYFESLGYVLIEAIVCTMGNASRDAACVNTMRLLEIIGRTDVPLYRGALLPIIPPPPMEFFNGNDGFGDLEYDTSPNMSLVQDTPAPFAIGELVTNNPGEITVICLAALTNIAIAAKLFDNFQNSVQELWIMGGSYAGFGNVEPSPTAEWNFFIDPESAHSVLENIQRKTYLVTWETSLANRISFDWRYNVFAKAKENNPAIKLLTEAEKKVYAGIEDAGWGPPDALVAAAFADNLLITKSTKYQNGTVELHGTLTRGQMVLTQATKDSVANITVINNLDIEAYKNLLMLL